MSELGVVLFTLLEAVSTAVRGRIGARRARSYLKPYMLSSKHDRILPRFIRKHFNLSDRKMHIAVCYRYVISYLLFLRPLVLVVCALLLPFRYYLYAYTGSFCLVALLILLLVVVETVMVDSANKQIKKLKTEKKRMTFLGFFVSVWQESREILDDIHISRIHRTERAWREPLTKELSRCLRKYKGVSHMFPEGLSYANEKIFPKYNQHVTSEVSQNEKHKTFLRVYAKSDGRVVFEAPVKNK